MDPVFFKFQNSFFKFYIKSFISDQGREEVLGKKLNATWWIGCGCEFHSGQEHAQYFPNAAFSNQRDM